MSSTTHRTATPDAHRLHELRSMVAEERYEIDEPRLATAVLRRIGPLLTAPELPAAPRPRRARIV